MLVCVGVCVRVRVCVCSCVCACVCLSVCPHVRVSLKQVCTHLYNMRVNSLVRSGAVRAVGIRDGMNFVELDATGHEQRACARRVGRALECVECDGHDWFESV